MATQNLLEQIREMFGKSAAMAAALRAAREKVKTLTFELVGEEAIGRMTGFRVKVGLETPIGNVDSVFVVIEPRGQQVGRVFVPIGFGANAPYRVLKGHGDGLFAIGPQESWVQYEGQGNDRKPVVNERGYVVLNNRAALFWDDVEGDRLLQDIAVKAVTTVIAAAQAEQAASEASAADEVPY